jgi:hypothetical protein
VDAPFTPGDGKPDLPTKAIDNEEKKHESPTERYAGNQARDDRSRQPDSVEILLDLIARLIAREHL